MSKTDKILTVLAAIIVVLFTLYLTTTAAKAADAWTARQEWAHEIAESARAQGLDEDNPIILECKRIWAEEEDAKRMTYVGRFHVTGYDTCAQCCGTADGITASGTTATVGRTIATGREFPFGTILYIDGIGERVVEDRGVKNGVIDVLCENHAECYAITGTYDIYEVSRP